jgi:hypothetical protein
MRRVAELALSGQAQLTRRATYEIDGFGAGRDARIDR